MSYNFIIPGPAVAKQSGTIVKNPKTGRSFLTTKPKSRNYANWVKMCFCNAFPHFKPIDGYMSVVIKAYFPFPKSYSKKKVERIKESGFFIWKET